MSYIYIYIYFIYIISYIYINIIHILIIYYRVFCSLKMKMNEVTVLLEEHRILYEYLPGNMTNYFQELDFIVDKWVINLWKGNLTLFRMGKGRGKKVPPTSFSPVTSTNVGISL